MTRNAGDISTKIIRGTENAEEIISIEKEGGHRAFLDDWEAVLYGARFNITKRPQRKSGGKKRPEEKPGSEQG